MLGDSTGGIGGAPAAAAPERTPTLGRVAFAVSVAGACLATLRIGSGRPGGLAVVAWLGSVVLLPLVFSRDWWPEVRELRLSRKSLGVLAVLLLPVAVRLLNADGHRVIGDELITGFFSATEDLGPARFFAEVPQARAEWVSQFPTLFFVLQRAFFDLFGDGLAALRLSIQPYVFVASLFLYLTARRILGRRTALLAVVLHSFLAIALYLETVGLDFVSSTAVFMAFFHFAHRLTFGDGLRADAVLTGLLSGFCYLFYTSSYVALPVLAVFLLVRIVRDRGRAWYRTPALAALGLVTVLGPFAAYALKVQNYFRGRIDQVSLLTGQWSDAPQRMRKGESVVGIVGRSAWTALRSVWADGIGGHGGYWFGHQALFDRFSFALFVAGLVCALFLLRRHPALGMVLLVMGACFVTGVVLTIPPPAYHRLSLTFPFIALVLALPLHVLWGARSPSLLVKQAVTAGVVALFASTNLDAFSRGALPEYDCAELRIASVVQQRYPGRKLYVAAFPGNAFEKMAWFAPNRTPGRWRTGYHDDLLASLNTDEKYVYLVLFPDEFAAKFSAADPRGRYVKMTPDWAIFAN